MPEASMEVPGARETAVRTVAARSSIERRSPAELERAFESDGPAAEIEAFFVRTLPPKGWTYSGKSWRGLEWQRDGYLFQLRLPDPNEPWPGGFSYSIFGPRN
jgi:hypothetical protein